MTDEERAMAAYLSCDHIPHHEADSHAKEMAPFFADARAEGERSATIELLAGFADAMDGYDTANAALCRIRQRLVLAKHKRAVCECAGGPADHEHEEMCPIAIERRRRERLVDG